MRKLFVLSIVSMLALGTAMAASEQQVVNDAAEMVRQFRSMPERGIPEGVLRDARGLAIIRVLKIGFGLSGKGGQGVVVARTDHGWSGPSFIGTGGAGWGAQIGAEVTDFILVLNTRAAVRAFAQSDNVHLGADVSAAAGPVGRDLQAGVTPTAAVYTYSRSRGLFAGASLEGAIIFTQKDAIWKYYGRPVSAGAILNGHVPAPRGAAVLRAALR
ncbi:MAG: lipid-binding SYLF domain-containing protein [Chthoniobacterales bacterium]|jgi:SH3 domain-containing YSC84-like protein 1